MIANASTKNSRTSLVTGHPVAVLRGRAASAPAVRSATDMVLLLPPERCPGRKEASGEGTAVGIGREEVMRLLLRG